MNDDIRIFQEATAVITGAASGIGRCLAKELASRGCTVVLADKQIDLAAGVVSEILSAGGNAWAREVDVIDFLAVSNLIQEVVAKTGRLDYMINNAGIAIGGPVEEYELSDWDRTIDVNIRGVTNGIQACYSTMISQGFGHIINTSSLAGLVPIPGAVVYSASKFAVAGLSQALRVEAEHHGIRVSVLCPGAIKTPILEGGKYGKLPKGFTPEKAARFWAKYRPVPPQDFARMAVDKIAKNKAIIILPGWWSILYWIYRFSWRLWFMDAQKRFTDIKKLMEE